MNAGMRHDLKDKLNLIKQELEPVKSNKRVQFVLAYVDEATRILNWEEPAPTPSPFRNFTDDELIAELQKRLSEKSYPARA